MSIVEFTSHVVAFCSTLINDTNTDASALPTSERESEILQTDLEYVIGAATADEHLLIFNNIQLVKHIIQATTVVAKFSQRVKSTFSANGFRKEQSSHVSTKNLVFQYGKCFTYSSERN